MARQLCERFSIPRQYGDLNELLEHGRPNVVHVTTPPKSHHELAKACLERGAHVYVEKPFTLNASEARSLIALANERGLKLTVGHDEQFSHVARRMRDLVARGYLGGPPVHMESTYGYDLSGPDYARAVLGDRQHWVRGLPGKLLHNTISHGIARIAEYVTDEAPRVIAHGFVSPPLLRMQEASILDELRVVIVDADRATAYFTFSSGMRPPLHEFKLYGPRNGLILNQDQESLLKLRGARFKSFAEKFVPQVELAEQHLVNLTRNLNLFLARDLHMKAGMKYLIEAFYRSIVQGTPLPIPYLEIVLTARIMDSIFEQLAAIQAGGDDDDPAEPEPRNQRTNQDRAAP